MDVGNSTKSVLERPVDDETPPTSSGSITKASHSDASEDAGSYKCKYNVYINNSKGVVVGDDGCGHITAGSVSKEQEPNSNGELDVRIREQARIDCGNILAPVDLEQPIVPVNLEIASKPVRVSSELDEEGHFHKRKDFVKLYEQPPGNFSEIEMLQHPKQEAQKKAGKFQTENEREDYVAKNGNIIGVVGQPGIGKTTSMKKWVKYILDGKMIPTVTFLFLIFVRNIDFSQKMTLFELLVSTVLPDWEHSTQADRAWLKKILKNRNVLIALDGFDEAAVKDLRKRAPKVNLYDKADPLNLLLNLISGNLLPYARIIITSRPAQLYHLHPDHRPKFVVQILGLNRQGQDELGRQICGGKYEVIRGVMLKNADIFLYCYVPVNFILTVCFLMNCESDMDFVCMSNVLSFACERYSSGEQLKNEKCNLDKLSKLAWNGFKKMQIIFEEADLGEANLDAHTIRSFMNTSVVDTADMSITIMEGHKRSYFSHLIWQEYFAAMYLMLFASDQEFEESLEHLFDNRWQVVTKFLFGMCNSVVYQSLKCVTSTRSSDQWKKKKSELLKVATHRTEHYVGQQTSVNVSNEDNWQKLLHICSCVHEVNDKDITRDVAARFCNSITMYGTLLPNDISNFFHVVRAARTLPMLDVDRCKFIGDSLTRFWKEVVASGIKVRRFDLGDQKISDDDLPNIVESLQRVEELCLCSCNVSRNLVAALAKRWEQTKPQIQILDLANYNIICDELHNQIGDEAVSCLIGCLQNIRKLRLFNCAISSTGVEMLAEKLLKTGHKLELLDLGGNIRIGDEGARSLVSCLHLIDKLLLRDCGFTQAARMEEMRSKLKKLDLPEDRVEFY